MDLGGAPYAYTPFCDSRKDMDGFRFWKQGYWRNHLQGRKYHISALYVVDLKRFRKIAAGDRLRGQYQVRERKRITLTYVILLIMKYSMNFYCFIFVGIESRPKQFVEFGSRFTKQYDSPSGY